MKRHDQNQQPDLRDGFRTLSEANGLTAADEVVIPVQCETLAHRGVAQLLDKGFSYRDIRDITEVSVTTIGRVARFMELGAGGYRRALERTGKNSS